MQRCGLCSLLSRLLRRAMCVGSRRGSGESYYQELAETAGSPPSPKSTSFKHAPDVATMETTDSSIYIRLIPASNQQEQQRRQSQAERENCLRRRVSDTDQDRPLLEALLYDEKIDDTSTRRRHVCNGRFLTMHKRRRKKLTTRSLAQDSAILDDVLHGQVQCILNQVGNWRFNAFTLETVTGGRSLPVLCVHLFHWYGLLDHFNLDVVRLWKLFTLIEEGYHSTNPYHNSIHATDVTQAMHCYLQERRILENLTPVEIMASLIGAVTHDLDHPGVNQPFLIATSNHLAALYENTSVLENHHWRSAVGCLLESGVAEQIQDIRPELEKQIASLILATDITRQNEFLTKFRDYIEQDSLDMTKAENRHFILQIALKCADISNPCRPWDISKKWSQKVCEEFFRQGDYERQLNLPVTSLCDRYSMSVPKIQVGFFKYVVTPLFVEWHRFLNTDLSTRMMKHLKDNQDQWESKVAAELAEETKTEISDAELLEEDFDDEDIEVNADISDSSEVLLPEVKLPRRSSLQVPTFGATRFDRRHSVPVNPPRIILPPRDNVSRSAIREDIESKLDDSFSLLSSDSDSGPRKSSTGSVPDRERPLSAETLVPELNIATMSNSECADRLNLVMHGAGLSSANMLAANSASKHLIRQQTFPPLQPYMRTRYMSATAEMSSCSEALEKHSSSSDSPPDNDRERGILTACGSKKDKKEGGCSGKREQDNLQCVAEKSCKMVKLSIPEQKENMDPTMLKKGLARRRGSAPVAVASPPKTTAEESVSLLIRTCDTFMRRGSMPAEVIYKPSNDKQLETFLLTTQNLTPFQRRGSVPCDNKSSNRSNNNNCNGKTRNRKKLLRRRSSGGAEILTPILAEAELAAGSSSGGTSGSSAWYRFKRTDRSKSDIESLLSRRRGSLPVEVLAVCHTGTLRH
ncbi:uncharacterized protein LOC119647762 isoform X3 [Hermetia illucens]|uniref:uncharacterized protein LOC119647762 isoform X3 n=1 Tax=Hermetia illucens TaxID=343691 RepID=UPI0018CC469B|nr:uncharacterized protein LOC119647762 isoform X3 [Hermetia illucens]